MFDWLYKIFGTILAFFNDITGHYALALILYALVFKILFLPFSIKTQKNQIKMAELRPKMKQYSCFLQQEARLIHNKYFCFAFFRQI